jgi:multidrug resistance efflux pump
MKDNYKFAVTLSVVALAAVSAWLLYKHYANHPWTRDGQVRANIVGIAPRVAGPIIQIPIHDNQSVKKGDLLFEIDPATFEAAVANSAAKLQQAEAAELQAKQDLDRQTALYQTNVIDIKSYQDAQDEYAATVANTAAAKAQLKTDQLNLGYTKVFAPVDGYLTNVNTSPGTYVNVGEQLLALVDASSFWVAGYFKETQISKIQPRQKAKLALMGHENQPFEGEVVSTGWAVFIQDGSTVELIPAISQTIDWVQLPQRFAVRVKVTGTAPVPLRIGQTISVAIE